MASFLGIEITKDDVLAVLVKTNITGKAIQAVRYLNEPIAFDGPEAAVQALMARVQSDKPDVVVRLAGTEASTRRVSIPLAAMKKLEELLPFEVESQLPFDLDEGMLESQLIGTDAEKVHVLAAALPNTRIEAALETFKTCGLDPERLSFGALPLAGLTLACPEFGHRTSVLVVSSNNGITDFAIVEHGAVQFARSVRLDFEPTQDGFFPHSLADGVHHTPSVQALMKEIRQTLLAARAQHELQPAELWMLGSFAPLQASIAAELHLASAQPTLPVPAPMKGEVQEVGAQYERYAFALGLAALPLVKTRTVDFRRGLFRKLQSRGARKEYGALIGVAALAVVASFVFAVTARYWAMTTRRDALAEQLAGLSRDVLGEETRSVERARRLLSNGRESADPLPSFTAYDALMAVSNAVPTSVAHHDVQKLEIDLGTGGSEGHFELAGTVTSIEESERIRNALAEVRCFQELEMGPSNQTQDGKRQYRIEGTILCPEQARQRPTKAAPRRGH